MVHREKSSLRQDPATRPWMRAGVWCVQSEEQRESASMAVGMVPGVGNWGDLGRHWAEPAGRSQLSCQAFWVGLGSQGISGPKTTSPVKRNAKAPFKCSVTALIVGRTRAKAPFKIIDVYITTKDRKNEQRG